MSQNPGSASTRRFPDRFVWGAATASFQIEGGAHADGKGESIWDRFCRRPGAIADGSNGDIACDHYTRWEADLDLMSSLGLGAYRFSIAWPRVIPDGTGALNQRGLDFYDRLVDGLLERGIVPYPTLYHWDLPQALEDRGGWPSRVVPEAFAAYTEAVVGRLGDRVTRWSTINEPFVVANHGYLTGEHAPGRSNVADSLAASHHVLLAHAVAVERIRSLAPAAEVGIVLNFTPATLVGSSPAAILRHRTIDDVENRWYVEPIAGLGYPAETAAHLGWDQHEVLDDDLDRIAAPIDFLGINFYTRNLVGVEGERPGPRGPENSMGWEIHAPSLSGLLRNLHERYAFPAYVITENGAAMPDEVRSANGAIDDQDRLSYYAGHLGAVHDAITDGVPVEGYFAWSLLDNFEWAHGYRQRFGLVEVDYETMERRPKRSAHWYSQVARTGLIP